jgi:CspA family cold shock protein
MRARLLRLSGRSPLRQKQPSPPSQSADGHSRLIILDDDGLSFRRGRDATPACSWNSQQTPLIFGLHFAEFYDEDLGRRLWTTSARFHLEHIMALGTVKWFNPQKGFGFIQREEGGTDVFVHISAVEQAGLRTLNDGQKISFDLEQGRQGKTAAVNLKIA